MKTTNRVRKDSSAAPSAQQVKTPPGKTVLVFFYSSTNGREFCRVDFPEKVFAAIERTAKTLGLGLDKFFEEAVQGAIEACAVA